MTRRVSGALLVALVTLATLFGSSTTLQATTPRIADRVEITGVRVGFAGVYKVGYWTPVEVQFDNRTPTPVTGHVELILPDGDGTPTRVTSPAAVEIPASDQAQVTLYAKFGRLESSLRVRFVQDGNVLVQRDLQAGEAHDSILFPSAVPATDEVILTLGPAVGVEELSLNARRRNLSGVHQVELTDFESLPTAWYGYEGVDAIIVSTSDASRAPAFSADSPPARAINLWIELGGRAILGVGQQAEEVLGDGSFLGQLAPGRFSQMIPLRRGTALEMYADTKTPLETRTRQQTLEVPQLIDVRGRIEAYEGNRPTDLPLVVRAPHGFGEVVLITLDLDQPPLANWAGRAAVLNRLLARTGQDRRAETSDTLGAVTTIGYTDLSGQLRAALEQFGGVTVVSFALVGGLVFVYLLLIGPFDYWLVRNVLRRYEATWITFSLTVVVISLGAYFAAYAFKGRELRTNEVELIDFDLATSRVRGSVWANLFSPEPASYDLALEPKLPTASEGQASPEVLMSWMGLPGRALGGMQAGSSNPPLFNQPYDFSPTLASLRQVPVQIWSTKGFVARWHGESVAPLRGELEARSDGMLTGQIVNQTGIDLTDVRLHYDRWVYPLSTLQAEQSVRIGDRQQPLTSRTLLTRQRAVKDSDIATVYNSQSDDVPRIMEMMMFHQLAGGERYTAGLTNRYQGFTDLSGHLALGRAVLVGRAAESASTLSRDGAPIEGENHPRWTFYRFVIPVASQP